jgi:hypothetical protein
MAAPPEPPLPDPQPTIIRLTNMTDHVVGRDQPCTGTYTIGVLRDGDEPPPRLPTCAPVACESIAADETVAPEAECVLPSCADGIVRIVPGASDDYVWDGVYRQLTERNCWQRTAVLPGAPMTAFVCVGPIAESGWELEPGSCFKHSFAYGDELTVVEAP